MTRSTSLSLVTMLAMLAGACGSDSPVEPDLTPEPLTVRDWRVVPLSGDQSLSASSASAAASLQPLVSANVIGADGYSAEPLVARIELTAEAQARGATLAGLPTGTLVHWHISDHGGKLYGSTTTPDDSAHILNRWAPSTRASDYTITAGRLVDGEIVTDATWTVTVQPGPAAHVEVPSRLLVWLGDTLDVAGLATVTDEHGNPLPAPTWEGVDSTLLYIPTAEGYDTLTVSSGGASREVEIVAIQLPGPGWTYSLVCRDIAAAPYYYDVPSDSARIVMVIDSIDAPARPTGSESQLRAYWTGEIRSWDGGDSVGWTMSHWDHAILTLRPGWVKLENGRSTATLIATDNPPTRYEGEGNFCGQAAEIVETFTAPD